MLPGFLVNLFNQQSYNPDNFFLIAGPCVVETEELVMEIADKVSVICKRLEIPYVFKASYRKANRTSADSFTGIGDDNGLSLIKKVGDAYHLPTTSDIHAHEEALWPPLLLIFYRYLLFYAGKQISWSPLRQPEKL